MKNKKKILDLYYCVIIRIRFFVHFYVHEFYFLCAIQLGSRKLSVNPAGKTGHIKKILAIDFPV